MLACNDLKVYYPIRRGILNRIAGYVRAVDGVSLEIQPGETLGIVGESGCGKTTLGRALAALEKPAAGSVTFNGTPLRQLNKADLREFRRSVQMVFQDPFSSLDPRMCAADIITEGAEANRIVPPEGSYRDFAARLMREVGLEPESMFRHPHEFSGGQRQRLSIARALALNPSYLICDEPVSALDVSVQAQIIKLLIALREQHHLSYLFISHDLSVVRLIAQKV
ncbi:MAG: ABC transporter ATP-binding protein, partial [Victivallales bacterium]|nr:ABC transporter ATP-binding protein [Victivallales bacterium]